MNTIPQEPLPTEVIDRVNEAVAEVNVDVIAWRRHLHQHPELSNREINTEKFIIDKLKGFGYENISGGLAGHGVLAVLHGRGRSADGVHRSILLRADMDALPVKEKSDLDFRSLVVDNDYPGGPFPVAHACGHDCHMAMLLGAAKVIQDLRDDVPGNVVFSFQPAEEGPPVAEDGGAKMMLREDVFSSLDPQPTMAFGMHVAPGPKNTVLYSTHVQNASSELVKITVGGEQTHGSMPWLGRDPLPPAADIIAAMGQIYRQLDAADTFTISIGHVEDEGRFNIVGEQVVLWGTVRCLADGIMSEINDKISRIVSGISSAYNCSGETEFMQRVPAVVNTPAWIEAALPSFNRTTGDESKVIQIPPVMGYDDVSEFINRYGGIYAMLGVQDITFNDAGEMVPVEGGRGFVPNHNPRFYADDDSLLTGVKLHVNIALDHLRGAINPSDAGTPGLAAGQG